MPAVTHSPDASRFESGEAHLEYRRTGDTVDLQHTVVPKSLGGQGIGGALVHEAVTWARAEGLDLVVTCPFARKWLAKHPQT